eukprot:scaffold40315_cov65-Phaeocystis_antarctica.AAC.2
MHELLNEREQGQLVVQLMNASATRTVLFEQHIPYLSFSAVAAFAALGERAEPTFIQLVREPTARWLSMHYFVRACFCDTKGGTRPRRTGPVLVRAEDNALQTVRPASHVQCSSELKGAQPGRFGPPRADGLLAALPSHSRKKADCSQGSLSPSSL